MIIIIHHNPSSFPMHCFAVNSRSFLLPLFIVTPENSPALTHFHEAAKILRWQVHSNVNKRQQQPRRDPTSSIRPKYQSIVLESTIYLSKMESDPNDTYHGPSDFTENILQYLLPDSKLPNVIEPTKIQGAQKLDMEEYVSSDEPFSSSPDARNSPSHLHRQMDEDDQDSENDVRSEASPSERSQSRLRRLINEEKTPSRKGRTRSASSSTVGDALRRGNLRSPIAQPIVSYASPMESSATVKALETSLRLLRQELESVKINSIADREAIRDDLEDRLRQERRTMQGLAGENISSKGVETEAMRALRHENEELKLEKLMLKQQLHDRRSPDLIDSVDSEIVQTLRNEVASLKQQLSSSSNSSNQLQAQITDLRQQLSSKTSTSDALQAEVTSLKHQLTTSSLTSKNLRAEISTLNEKVSSTTASNTSHLADLQNELVIANDRTDDLLRDRDAEHAKLQKLATSYEKRLRELKVLKRQFDESQRQTASLKVELDSRANAWAVERTALDVECEKRGKLLMIEWGKRECGGGEHAGGGLGQPYKYMYSLDGEVDD